MNLREHSIRTASFAQRELHQKAMDAISVSIHYALIAIQEKYKLNQEFVRNVRWNMCGKEQQCLNVENVEGQKNVFGFVISVVNQSVLNVSEQIRIIVELIIC